MGTKTLYSALQELGIGANLTRQHTIEISDGPISRIDVDETDPHDDPDKYSIGWVVPDSRIGQDFPQIAIRSVRIKRFPLLGSVKEVRWEPDYVNPPKDLDSSSFVADSLIQDKEVSKSIISDGNDVRISSDPEEGNWILGEEEWLSKSELTKRAHRFECYRVVAQCLLATPLESMSRETAVHSATMPVSKTESSARQETSTRRKYKPAEIIVLPIMATRTFLGGFIPLTLVGKVLCTGGSHQGEWAHDVKDGCSYERTCRRCGSNQSKECHRTEWLYVDRFRCLQHKKCTKCLAYRATNNRTYHDWGDEPSMDERLDGYEAKCRRCGKKENRSPDTYN